MDSERKRSIIVGIFVLLAAGVAVLMIALLGAEQRIFEERFRLRAVFGDVSGMRSGAPVFVAGLAVGSVEQLRFVAPEVSEPTQGKLGQRAGRRVADIEVVMNVEERFRPQIRTDSIATVGSVGLLGDKSIEISVGTASANMVEDGAVLETIDPVPITAVLDEVQPIAVKLDRILGDIAILTDEMSSEDSALRGGLASLDEILRKIDRGEGTLGALVNSPKTVEELDALLASARDVVGQIREATTDLPPTMASVRKGAAEVEQLAASLRQSAVHLPAMTAQLETVTENLELASETLPTLSMQAERGVRKANDVLDSASRSILLRGNLPGPPPRPGSGFSRTAPELESDG